MTRLTRVCRAVGVGLAVVTATLAMTQVANAAPPPPPAPPGAPAVLAPPKVDPTIQPPTGNQPFLLGRATGVQTYKCTNGQLATTGSVPTADLVGDNNRTLVIVKHSAGPTWTATDGSTAVKKDPLAAIKSAPSPNGSIAWLLLEIKGAAGPNGDRLAGTTFIQRVNTTGGVSPGGACTEDLPVHYTADYYFWKATGGA